MSFQLTIQEIANLAKVSKTTVSRVLNNRPDVKEETRKKVLAIINKYDYQPNAFAKAISLKKSYNIGLIISHYNIFTNPYYDEFISGVSEEINKRGYYVSLCDTGRRNYLDMFKQKRVEGFIILGLSDKPQEMINNLEELKVPYVGTFHKPNMSQIERKCIDIDNYQGAVMAMEHLISLGHRRIGFINGFKERQLYHDRLRGYRDTLEKHHLQDEASLMRWAGYPSYKNGYNSMRQLLKEQSMTAAFAAGDMMALGAMKAITDSGLRVPEDISVIGFDDILFSEFADLTTIKQPIIQKGKIAARMLIHQIEGKSLRDNYQLELKLMIRKSTAGIGKLYKMN
jgi:LacI family transcriptional regulator